MSKQEKAVVDKLAASIKMAELTDEQTILLGEYLFGRPETDNDNQFLFYTGIYETIPET